jgi:hypothetical protein
MATKAGILGVRTISRRHAIGRPGRADHVLFDHHAAHVVGAEGEAELPDLAALRHPRRLQVVEVVEHEPREGERAQVFDAGRLAASPLGVFRLVAPCDERGEPAGFVLRRPTCSRRSSSVSTVPYIIVAVVRSPAWCAWRITSSHSSEVALPKQFSSLRTRSTRISAPPPGMLSIPAAMSRAITSGTGSLDVRDR